MLELGAGLLALGGVEGLEPIEHPPSQLGRDGAGEDQVSVVVELPSLLGGETAHGQGPTSFQASIQGAPALPGS